MVHRWLATLLLIYPLSALPPLAHADSASTCFDFSRAEGVKPLSTPIAFDSPERRDTTASGPHAQGGGWGAARALLAMPITEAARLLRDQAILKDPKDSDLEVTHETRPGLLDFERVEITVHPFPLISIQWTEEWAYRITQGTQTTPAKY